MTDAIATIGGATIKIALFDHVPGVRPGSPVRLEWPERAATAEWLAHSHFGLRAWTDERYRVADQARRSSIVVPLGPPDTVRVSGWSEQGAGDEGAMDYARVAVRPATEAEAAPVLAAERRDATLGELLDELAALTRLPQHGGMEWIADPPTPGGEPLGEADIARLEAAYGARADQELTAVRMWRHVHALTAYRLVRPGQWPESDDLLRPDPAAGVVWWQRGCPGAWPRCYPLAGDMARVVEGLTALLDPMPPHPA